MWIDTTYVDNLLGSSTRTAVAPTTAVFNQFEASARAQVVAVIQFAGYSSPGSTLTAGTDSTAFLQKLCAAQWVKEAFGNRKGIKFPPSVEDGLGLLTAVYERKIPVPGLTPSEVAGHGGAKFSDTSGSGTRPRAQRLSRDELSGM